MTHSYNITGITCGNCVAKIKSELLKIGDVLSADVRMEAPQATITMQNHVPTATLQKAITNAGTKYIITGAGGTPHSNMQEAKETSAASYFPIFLIFAYIAGVSTLVQFTQPVFNWMQWMGHFMAGFFFVFSFFKLMNLRGFAEGYRTYDVVAKAIPAYGFIYPFVELALGIAFLTGLDPFITNIATLLIMGISSIGVIQNLMKKNPVQCACLGTVIKLPLSKVTVFEDLLMVAMSIIMLVSLYA